MNAFSAEALDQFPAGLAILVEERVVWHNRAFAKLFALTPGDDQIWLHRLFDEGQISRLQSYLRHCSSDGVLLKRRAPAAEFHYRCSATVGEHEGKPAHFLSCYDETISSRVRASLERAFDFFANQLATPRQQSGPLSGDAIAGSEYQSLFDKLQLANDALQRDLNLAVAVQESRLPPLPASRQWDISYYFRPMAGVSGDIIDIYDFSDVMFFDEEGEENLGVVLLDASGHGMSAALVTAVARPIFYEFHRLNKNGPLKQAFMDANVELCRELGSISNYLTGVSLRLGRDYFSTVNGAHPLVIYRRQRDGRIFEIENDGILFGIPDLKGDFVSRRVENVASGDLVLLYSDGLSEATNPAGKQFGVDRIKQLLRESKAESAFQVQQELLDAWLPFIEKPEDLSDDVSFVVIRKR